MTTDTPPPHFTTRRFALVLVLGLLASSGAFWLSMQRHLPRDASFGTEALPGLAGRLTEVDRLRLTGVDGTTVTLARRAGHFVVEERAGYAADAARVHALLAALADLRIAERQPVTRSSWAAHGLDPGLRIELSGRLPARTLVLGRPVGPENAYVRIGATDEVVEAGPAPVVDVRPTYWLRQRLVDIAPGEVRRIEYGPAGSALVLERREPGAPFVRQGPHAAGATPAALAGAEPALLRALDVQDVRAAGGFAPTARTVVETFAGLQIECTGRIEADRHWLRLTARHLPAPGVAPADAERARQAADRLVATTSGFELQIAATRFAELFLTIAAAPEFKP